jgi:FK506-binding nuclear protein
MAAIDPTEAPEADDDGNIPDKPRATLKLIRQKFADLDDEMDNEYLEALMGGSDDEEDSDEEDANGGPSDPSKSKKAKAEAALQKLIQAAQEEQDDSDDEMADADGKANGKKGKKAAKGKEPATSSDDDEEDSEDDDEGYDLEEFVICTLDTERVSLFTKTLDDLPPANSYSRTTNRPLISPLDPRRRSSSVSLVPTPFT